MKYFFILMLLAAPVQHTPIAWAESSLNASEIVERVDAIRNPQEDYRLNVRITSYKPDSAPKTADYEVLVKGRDKTLVKTLAPPIDRGTSMLMLGYDFWVFLPSISKPLRVSLQQRLLGEVAYGDIARANFSGDYSARVLEENVDLQGVPSYLLELTAVDERVTYHRVLLWAAMNDCRPVKAEFYAVSGKLLKTCVYEDYREAAGVLRPHRLVLEDPLRQGQKSIMEYSDIRAEAHPEKFFTKEYLEKLRY